MILAIDPGNIESAYVVLNKEYKPLKFEKIDNYAMLEVIKQDYECDTVVIEKIASYGMSVGQTVFDTCIWIGRFTQLAYENNKSVEYVFRAEEKMDICHSMKANDTTIRQALKDRFGEVGTKKNPGFFYGFKKDIWAAMSTGVVYLDKKKGIFK